MVDSGYFLTYDLKILFCPNLQLSTTCKEINVDTHLFSQFDGSVDAVLNAYPIDKDDVNPMINNILTGPIGDELPQAQMDWIITFENLLKEDASIITNRDLAFNYFILKFILMGFSPDFAKDLVINYYEHIIRDENVPHPQVLLNQINKFLTYKKFWVKADLRNEKMREFKMMKKIMKAKKEMDYKFNFDLYCKKEYLELIRHSIVPVLIKFNQKESYLVKEKIDLNSAIPYVTQVYQEILLGIINKICELDNIPFDEPFVNNLLKEMTGTVKLYLTINSNDFAI